MNRWSQASRKRLHTCDKRLIEVANAVLELMDVTVIEGHRTQERQEYLYSIGRSRTMNSKHLAYPSQAIDLAPYPVVWPSGRAMSSQDGQAFARFAYMIGMARGYAHAKGIKLRSGLDWDSDGEIADTSFFDLPHLELIG